MALDFSKLNGKTFRIIKDELDVGEYYITSAANFIIGTVSNVTNSATTGYASTNGIKVTLTEKGGSRSVTFEFLSQAFSSGSSWTSLVNMPNHRSYEGLSAYDQVVLASAKQLEQAREDYLENSKKPQDNSNQDFTTTLLAQNNFIPNNLNHEAIIISPEDNIILNANTLVVNLNEQNQDLTEPPKETQLINDTTKVEPILEPNLEITLEAPLFNKEANEEVELLVLEDAEGMKVDQMQLQIQIADNFELTDIVMAESFEDAFNNVNMIDTLLAGAALENNTANILEQNTSNLDYANLHYVIEDNIGHTEQIDLANLFNLSESIFNEQNLGENHSTLSDIISIPQEALEYTYKLDETESMSFALDEMMTTKDDNNSEIVIDNNKNKNNTTFT
ncbi:hypothetical protein ABSA28_01088 [Candidatus Hepatincolaceae symbiont of Richtersius coronifer]